MRTALLANLSGRRPCATACLVQQQHENYYSAQTGNGEGGTFQSKQVELKRVSGRTVRTASVPPGYGPIQGP